MVRRNFKWVLAAVVAFAGAAFDADSADAGWRHRHGSSGGSWGSSGGSWGSSGGSWGSSGGSWGGHRWHRAYYSSGGSWGSSGGSWGSSGGSWGSSGGSSGGYAYYGSSGGSWGSSGGSSGGTVIMEGAPANPPAPPAEGAHEEGTGDVPPAPMPGAVYRRLGGDNLALLNVNVPADAKVFVNGAETTSTGTQRQFISRGLTAGNRYTYEVRVEMDRNGETVTETKSVTLGMGEQARLAFNADATSPTVAGEGTKTKLTLRVPADAKVFLTGRETSSTGEVREFTTTKLAPGAEWADYTVRVVANVDGREIVKEETITLIGGENRELNLGFGSTEVAQTAAVTR